MAKHVCDQNHADAKARATQQGDEQRDVSLVVALWAPLFPEVGGPGIPEFRPRPPFSPIHGGAGFGDQPNQPEKTDTLTD